MVVRNTETRISALNQQWTAQENKMHIVEDLGSMMIVVLSSIMPARMPALMDGEQYQYLALGSIDCFGAVGS
jgi:hypothetical protein